MDSIRSREFERTALRPSTAALTFDAGCFECLQTGVDPSEGSAIDILMFRGLLQVMEQLDLDRLG